MDERPRPTPLVGEEPDSIGHSETVSRNFRPSLLLSGANQNAVRSGDGEADAGRGRRDRCRDQRRVVLATCCNRCRYQTASRRRIIQSPRDEPCSCVPSSASRETRSLRDGVSRRSVQLPDRPVSIRIERRVDYVDRNIIEKWFHTLKMRVDRFHNSWVNGRSSVRRWLVQFVHYYNVQRPHQSLDGRTSAEGIN